MSFMSCGIAWATGDLVRDWLRTSADNDAIIGVILSGIPDELEVATGIPADLTRSSECPEIVRSVVMFMLSQRFDVEQTSVDRVVESLQKACRHIGLGD